ncbi:hypothetical protein BH20VER2_BH20VER2_00390 [soil metagenome]
MRKEAGHGELYRLGFADDDFADLARECVDLFLHA